MFPGGHYRGLYAPTTFDLMNNGGYGEVLENTADGMFWLMVQTNAGGDSQPGFTCNLTTAGFFWGGGGVYTGGWLRHKSSLPAHNQSIAGVWEGAPNLSWLLGTMYVVGVGHKYFFGVSTSGSNACLFTLDSHVITPGDMDFVFVRYDTSAAHYPKLFLNGAFYDMNTIAYNNTGITPPSTSLLPYGPNPQTFRLGGQVTGGSGNSFHGHVASWCLGRGASVIRVKSTQGENLVRSMYLSTRGLWSDYHTTLLGPFAI
jgi:hypothetical protein